MATPSGGHFMILSNMRTIQQDLINRILDVYDIQISGQTVGTTSKQIESVEQNHNLFSKNVIKLSKSYQNTA